MTYRRLVFSLFAGTAVCLCGPAHADTYVRGQISAAFLDDSTSPFIADSASGTLDGEFDTGFGAGAAIGRIFGDRFRAEIDYTYTSNDVGGGSLAGATIDGDNYASTSLGLNVLYHFNGDPRGADGWTYYGGLGLVWLNEIDIDLEGAGVSSEFEDLEGSEVAPRFLLGTQRSFGKRWSGGLELRYVPTGRTKLDNRTVRFEGLNYDNWSVGANISYWFD